MVQISESSNSNIKENSVSLEINVACERFVENTYREFQALHLYVEESARDKAKQNIDIQADINKGSQFLRGVLGAFVKELDEITSGNLSAETTIDVFIDLERIWHLCEVFLLHNPNKLMSLEIAKWIKSSEKRVFMENIGRDILGMAQPELYDGTKAGGMTYWQAVYVLAMQGDLKDCWELLSLHSKIAHTTDKSPSINIRSRRIGQDVQAAQQLQHLLTSHPYASLVDNNAIDNESGSFAKDNTYSAELQSWRSLIEQFKVSSAGSALLTRIQELNTLIRILEGEEDVICSIAGAGNWEGVALARLLYVYAPPLTRQNLCKILESSMNLQQRVTSTLSNMIDSDKNMRLWLKSVMSGQVGPALRAMFERGCEANLPGTIVQVPMLLANVYLCFLLIHGAGIVELIQCNPKSVQNSMEVDTDESQQSAISYYESLVQDACQEVHDSNLALEKLLCFIEACPTSANQMMLKLLPTHKITSDDELLQVSDILRHRAAYLTTHSRDNSLLKSDSHIVSQLLQSANQLDYERGKWWTQRRHENREYIDKCFLFYSRANDYAPIATMIEKSFQRCIQCVCACKSLFSGLNIQLVDCIVAVPMNAAAHQDNGSARTDLLAALNESQDILMASHVRPLLGDTIPERNGRMLLQCLQKYTHGIRTFAEYMENRTDSSKAAMQESITGVASLATQKLAPMRYWLHIVDISTWLQQSASDIRPHSEMHSPAVFMRPISSYGLLQSFEYTLGSVDGYRKQCANGDALDQNRRAIRLRGLQQLAGSLVTENATFFGAQSGTQGSAVRSAIQGNHNLFENQDILSGHSLY